MKEFHVCIYNFFCKIVNKDPLMGANNFSGALLRYTDKNNWALLSTEVMAANHLNS